MTFYVDFYAEQAFLLFVKQRLDQCARNEDGFPDEERVVAVLACAAALEAIANRIFELDGRLKHYDRLGIKEKLETLAEFGKLEINWGQNPWQSINHLIRVRNWLAHYKDTTLGLINSESQWLRYEKGNPKKFTPETAFSTSVIREQYNSVRTGLLTLAKALNREPEVTFLESEQYESFIVELNRFAVVS